MSTQHGFNRTESRGKDLCVANFTCMTAQFTRLFLNDSYVERYGNVYFADPEKVALRDPLAAVTINNGHGIDIENCTFQHTGKFHVCCTLHSGLRLGVSPDVIVGRRHCTGAWALALNNASQNVTVRDCTLWDLGGGGIMIGDVNMTSNITDPALQMAGIHVEVRQ